MPFCTILNLAALLLVVIQLSDALAVLNFVPPEPENGGSIAVTPTDLVYLLGEMQMFDLMC
jgi:hypothetical protein